MKVRIYTPFDSPTDNLLSLDVFCLKHTIQFEVVPSIYILCSLNNLVSDDAWTYTSGLLTQV